VAEKLSHVQWALVKSNVEHESLAAVLETTGNIYFLSEPYVTVNNHIATNEKSQELNLCNFHSWDKLNSIK
jgi:desulfoferrodoxin (superoxide reductase-like protein)